MVLSHPVRTVDHMATTTARQKTLHDGRTVTWLHQPIEAGGGRILYYLDTGGSIDGEPISDDKLHRLIGLGR